MCCFDRQICSRGFFISISVLSVVFLVLSRFLISKGDLDMHKKLFIPGPIEVAPEVLAKMAAPMIGHRSKAASALQKGIADKLRQLFYTQNEIILSTSSGSGLMEGSIRSCTAKRVAVFSVGAFGDRWYKMATANGLPADKFMSELGKATTPEMVDKELATGKYDVVTVTHNETSTGITNPVGEISEVIKKYPDVVWCVDAVSSAGGTKIEVDKLGIDVCITSSQKALGLPPGLAVCTVSTPTIVVLDLTVACVGVAFRLATVVCV
jgi:aspartate aminotransferase-like enzyme